MESTMKLGCLNHNGVAILTITDSIAFTAT